MTYPRFIDRNQLYGDYDGEPLGLIQGDLRRLETDTRDNESLDAYAQLAGVTEEQVKIIFDYFFEGKGPGLP